MKTTLDLLKEFVSIPSYFGENCNEAAMTAKVESLFKGSRYKVEKQEIAPGRTNLYIHDGTDPKILLLGHMDTVPPKKDTVGSSFDPRIEDGKLYGLGSGDMKAGLAIAVNQMLLNKKPGLALLASVDEEYDVVGAHEFVKTHDLHPELVLNLEPTDLEILNGCRGILGVTYEVRGKAAHAGKKHLGVNAIEKSVAISLGLQEKLKDFDIPNGPRNSVNLAGLKGGNLLDYDAGGVAQIGMSANLVPDYAFNDVEIRRAKSEVDLSLIQTLLEQLALEHDVRIEKLQIYGIPVGTMFVEPKKLREFEKAVDACGLPVKYRDVNAAGYYEAQILQEAWGCLVAIFGPGPFAMSHQANEYVDLDTVEKTELVINKYLEYTL